MFLVLDTTDHEHYRTGHIVVRSVTVTSFSSISWKRIIRCRLWSCTLPKS